ncbi:hypothetical protein IYR97_25650 (plasmid) [Pseudomonas fulva]|jgi:hypothetical protein|uniref:Transmembrane protein n=3 Tax=Pseudomonas TaxID=286 RepID=A0AAJ5S5V0_9PSED|nr:MULTISPECIES: hypothetical protein [Pseudomonas]MCT8162767.1 hypothetical protein [Pseudomonas sp. HD6422]MCT8181464.1 hypothetical protein [Pseudomonas sp. HD6421]MDH1928944.1 hypothetical protein [Pseudomonas sp. GD03696]MDM1712524.1 hypothetical protein [Pseudomonas sp. 165]QIZ22419.1 Hypothetical protein [Pseudomonas putida]
MSNREFFKSMWSSSPTDRGLDLDHFTFSLGYMRDWVTANLFDWIVDYSYFLIYLSFALSITLIFRRTLNAKSGLGALLAVLLLLRQGENYSIAHLIFGPTVNPQYLNVVLAAVALVGLGITVAVKRWRTIDRIMVFGAQGAVILTALLFHMLLVQTILPGWNFSIAWGNSAAVAPPEEMAKVCRENRLVCWQGDEFDPSAFNPYIRDQVRARMEMLRAEPIAELGTTFGSDNDLVSNGTMAVLVYKRNDHYWVIGDSRYGVRAHTVILRSFYILCAVAHSVWLFGAMGLIWFHKRRFTRRKAIAD